MDWRLKAAVQNVIGRLPAFLSYPLYYGVQRTAGGLRRFDPEKKLTAAVRAWKHLGAAGYDASGKVIVEVGTGRVPIIPLAFWLMGASETVTFDVNRYLRPKLVWDTVRYVTRNDAKVEQVFGPLLDKRRLEALLRWSAKGPPCQETLERCGIRYFAPADAARTPLPSSCADIHMSYAVLEHIPDHKIREIFAEANRIVKPDGVFLHRIDYSDHFAHTDRSISKINFLQYSEQQWLRYAGNRYMYMNRLRHDDHLQLIRDSGHEILAVDANVDRSLLDLLRRGSLRLDDRFRSKDPEVLATTAAWITSRRVLHEEEAPMTGRHHQPTAE